MIIDLSTPQIGFGSGNFTVNELGHLVAKGGEQITDWVIADNRLFKNNTRMTSHDFPTQEIGADLPNITNSVAFYAGKESNKNNFYITIKVIYLVNLVKQLVGILILIKWIKIMLE